MNADFPRIISLLRREKHISQKKAASELGISQALLSHYEKGIRECGLDFVVKVADYYQVSCDYLLGRSADRSGVIMTADDLPDPSMLGKQQATGSNGLMLMLHKKLILNSINIVYDILDKMNCRSLTNEVSQFLMTAIYRMFRILYSANDKNPQAIFSAHKTLYKSYADASMNMSEANAFAILKGSPDIICDHKNDSPPIPIELDSNAISACYPLFSSSLFNLVKNAEETIMRPLKRD